MCFYSKKTMEILRFDLNQPETKCVNRVPPGVDGEKSLMMWKELCRTGHYETDGNEHDIDTDFFRNMVATFDKRRKKGVEIPMPLGHTHDPEMKRGRVLFLEIRPNPKGGESLWGLVEFVDEAAKKALRNADVSIDAPEEVTDGDGETFQYALEHVALTDYPVVAGMEGFQDVRFSLVKGEELDAKWTFDALLAKMGLTGNYASPGDAYAAIFRKFSEAKGESEEDADEAGSREELENIKEAEMAKKKKFSEEDLEEKKDEKDFSEDGDGKDADGEKMSRKKKFSKKKKFSEDDEDEDEKEKEFDNGEDEDDEKDFSEDEEDEDDEEDGEKMSRKRCGKKFSRDASFQLLKENRQMKIDQMRRDGLITARQSNEMKKRYCCDRAVSFSLASGSNREFKNLCSILADGKRQDYGEQSGPQFSRDSAGKTDCLTAEFEKRFSKK